MSVKKKNDIIEEISKETGIPLEICSKVFSYCWTSIFWNISNLDHVRIYIPYIGTFYFSKTKIEELQEKLKYKISKSKKVETIEKINIEIQKLEKLKEIRAKDAIIYKSKKDLKQKYHDEETNEEIEEDMD